MWSRLAPAWQAIRALKASQRPTGGALNVFETSIEDGPPLHVHDREDECFYVLDGKHAIRRIGP
jgi:mannose-6-phosphate isomerase-like protein (cupin superfamily)